MRPLVRVGLRASVTVGLLITPGRVDAKHFENNYVAFDLPEGWSCDKEGDDWVCEPTKDAQGKVNMMAVVTAKYVGPDDSPQLYIRHIENEAKRPGIILVTPPRSTLINASIWLDAALANSEVKGYQTRYLVRTEGNIAVAVTFSAHHSVADKGTLISDVIAKSVQVNSAMAVPELQKPQ